MPTASAFEKRVKRHVIGRSHDFFAAVTPGLEPLCAKEMSRAPLAFSTVNRVSGGVKFTGRINDCYAANLVLKTANRILMRIDTFTATNFRRLEKTVGQFPWELYLKPDTKMRFSVSTRRSRLIHKKAIAECVQTGIERRFSGLAANDEKASVAQQVFIRAVDDRFTISLDSSGSLLYRRGIKSHPAAAPVRETIASAVLELAGYSADIPLLDPMCGAGTFSLEAAMKALNMPAGWFRDFAFFDWPAFRPRRWAYIRKQCQQQLRLPQQQSIYASDIDANACRQLKKAVASVGFSDMVAVAQKDFFDIAPEALTTRSGIVVMNPPYGRRVANRKESDRLFSEICCKLQTDFRGWRIGVLVPYQKWLKNIRFTHRIHPVRHGGLKVSIVTGWIG